MFMYMSDYPVEEILQFQQQVCEKLTPLSPVLFYLDQDDVERAARRPWPEPAPVPAPPVATTTPAVSSVAERQIPDQPSVGAIALAGE